MLFFYLLALSILLGSVVTTLVVTDRLAMRLETDAAKINMSGRQRMLSQRIIYLAQDLAQTPSPETRARLEQTITEFKAGIDLFAGSHEELSGRPNIESALRSLYFSASEGPSLDTRVRDYIDLARKIVRNPADADSLDKLKRIERNGLLRDLDAVVAEIEAISIAKIETMRRIEFISLVLAIMIVLIEIAVVFLPGHRLIRRTLDDLHARNEELERSRQRIDDQNAELRRSNEAVASERSRLKTALEESEGLRREQEEFTYSVSHDLKSPANTVGMVLDEIELDEDSTLSPDAREMLEHGKAAITRMGGQIEEVLADLEAEIRESGATVDIGPLGTVSGYRRQVRTLLQNLISNALKYREAGARPHIRIACTETAEAGEFLLTVADNGIGIDPEHHQRIFGLFQRLHRREEYPGSGLGLCTCMRVARNHDGRIDVTSAPGEGTTFSVTLRLDVGQENTLERIAA